MAIVQCLECLGRGSIATFSGDIKCIRCSGTGKQLIRMSNPSDTEMLDWLQANMKDFCKCWNSCCGHGLREAIADAMKKEEG